MSIARLSAVLRRYLPLSLIVAAFVVVAAPSTASAQCMGCEYVIGERVSGPGDACAGPTGWPGRPYVAENEWVKVCFQPDGEWLYVKDKDEDGKSAIGHIASRDRICRNKWGVGTWARCNYSFDEGELVSFFGYVKNFSTGGNEHNFTTRATKRA